MSPTFCDKKHSSTEDVRLSIRPMSAIKLQMHSKLSVGSNQDPQAGIKSWYEYDASTRTIHELDPQAGIQLWYDASMRNIH